MRFYAVFVFIDVVTAPSGNFNREVKRVERVYGKICRRAVDIVESRRLNKSGRGTRRVEREQNGVVELRADKVKHAVHASDVPDLYARKIFGGIEYLFQPENGVFVVRGGDFRHRDFRREIG